MESKFAKIFVSLSVGSVALIALYYGLCLSSFHKSTTPSPSLNGVLIDTEVRIKKAKGKKFNENTLDRNLEFNITGNDVLVFLHIQKTGGTTFGRHLVQDIELDKPCKCYRGQKKCDCFRPNSSRELWLFSRFSTGWSCGLHADYTELINCVDIMMDKKERQEKKRRYYFITVIREPVSRYLSEWQHVQRGATWKDAVHMCDGRPPTSEELPICYEGEDWKGVLLEEFMNCPHNLANNRQTRMLADLALVGCYNHSLMPEEERNEKILSSAKTNLRRMAFFGLTEFQKRTQYMFEKTFKLKFDEPFEQFDKTKSSSVVVTDEHKERIRQLNALDIELYAYAKNLFMQRYKYMAQENENADFIKEIANW
ncbi:heparan-sulfate 6-O-sulfotransferase 2-like isoform X2 [Ptychodera flava]|uniref:heparan-sulfate 6-O-sulfotransferase 2-like isoform X2 n=1 Tax=Ptychodera flava TaxID=63121 RepID=UPI00396A622C